MGFRDTLDASGKRKTIFHAGKSNFGQSSQDSVVTDCSISTPLIWYIAHNRSYMYRAE
jgi:hypothetical protein